MLSECRCLLAHGTHVVVRRPPWVSILTFHGLCFLLTTVKLVSERPRSLWSPLPSLPLKPVRVQLSSAVLSFSMGSGNSDLGPHVCLASALPTDPPPQTLNHCFFSIWKCAIHTLEPLYCVALQNFCSYLIHLKYMACLFRFVFTS